MALWLCDGTYDEQPCRTVYAVGLFRCPRCHSTDFHEFGSLPEDEEHMAKITRLGGPTNAAAEQDAETEVSDEPDVEPEGTEAADNDDGVEAAEAADEVAVERPTASASKADWAAYALTLGFTDEFVQATTKADLIAHIDSLDTGDDTPADDD